MTKMYVCLALPRNLCLMKMLHSSGRIEHRLVKSQRRLEEAESIVYEIICRVNIVLKCRMLGQIVSKPRNNAGSGNYIPGLVR